MSSDRVPRFGGRRAVPYTHDVGLGELSSRGREHSHTMEISVRRLGAPTWSVTAPVGEEATVGWLRERVREDMRLPPDASLALCHRGEVLADDRASLQIMEIHPSCVAVALPGNPSARAAARSPATSASASATRTGAEHGPEPSAPAATAPTATPAADTVDEPEGQDDMQARECRICFCGGSSRRNRLITPCRCSGSMRHVHARCLSEWRLRAIGTQSFTRCDQCRAPYAVQATSWQPLLKNPALVHGLTLFSVASIVAVTALLPFEVEAVFFRLVSLRPWTWLARRSWALRVLRGLLCLAIIGLGEHMHQLLRRDVVTRDACLRCMMLSLASNGPRLLRLFAIIGVLHSLGYAYVGARQQIKRLMLEHGEILVDRVG